MLVENLLAVNHKSSLPGVGCVDRLPPHSPEAEQGILGCVLLSPKASMDACAAAGCNSPKFYDLRNQTIFSCLEDLHDQGEAIDVITLQQRLKDKNLLEEVGGLVYLASLPDSVPSPANLSYYLEIVLEKDRLRKIIRTCTDVVSSVYDFEGEPSAFFEQTHRKLDALRNGDCSHSWLDLIHDGADIQSRSIPALVKIVDGILPEQCKLLIGSGSKSFKTWLAMQMGLCISFGLQFLGWETARRRVLFVNPELRSDAFDRRLQSLSAALGIKFDPKWFSHLPLRGRLAGATISSVISRLIEVARRLEVKVIFLDSLFKFNAGGDENSAGAQTVLFNEIDRLTTEAGCTVVLTDHFSKGNKSEQDPLDAVRGSSAKGGDVDCAMILRKHEVEGCFRVDMIHRELSPVEAFVIGRNHPLMELRADLCPDAMKKAKGGRKKEHDHRKLLAAIKTTHAGNPISVFAWAEAAKIPRQTLTGYLSGFRTKGWITTVGEGSSARQHITKQGKAEANAI